LYLGAHFPLDVIAGAGLGMLIGGVLNLVFGVPSTSSSTPSPTGSGEFNPVDAPGRPRY
jgi:membrane-associated phospholipid phosphatase